jgi:hypothetical protein
MPSTCRAYAALLLVAAALAAIAAVLMPAPASAMETHAPAGRYTSAACASPGGAQTADRTFAEHVVGCGTELDAVTVAHLALLRDAVCEGLTAHVPAAAWWRAHRRAGRPHPGRHPVHRRQRVVRREVAWGSTPSHPAAPRSPRRSPRRGLLARVTLDRVDPEPPAADLTCRQCGHGYMQHAPGGGACLVWSPEEGWHCGCPVFPTWTRTRRV